MNVAAKIVESETCTKRGLVGYLNNLFKEIDKIYATYDIGKLDLLKVINLWKDTNDCIEAKEESQNELSQSFQFEERQNFS